MDREGITFCICISIACHLVDCHFRIQMFLCISGVGWDGVVSVATCCGLVSMGIESWWGQDFLHLSRLALGPPASSTVGTRSLSPGVKQPGRSIDQPPLSSAKVKERVELYLFSSSGPSWPVLILTYLFTLIIVERDATT